MSRLKPRPTRRQAIVRVLHTEIDAGTLTHEVTILVSVRRGYSRFANFIHQREK